MPHSSDLLAGKYRLEEPIGTGGMGTVYRAVHRILDRPVAVKLLNVVGSDPLLGERFLREARVAAAVRHPNVVDIIDFGTTTRGQPFMVMELLEGVSLWDRMMASPPLTTDEVVEIIAQVLLGLEAVHRAGIIHRDLKPANIFVSPHDAGALFARLLDFGISYSIDPDSRMRRGQFGTDERLIVGTPEYISPEQAEGRPDVDVRSDVYAMGVILYELLTDGQLPYSDVNSGAVLFKVMSGGHVPLVKLRPDIPDLAAVVDTALSHDRARRYESAKALRQSLLAAVGRASEHAITPPGRRRVSSPDEVTQSMPPVGAPLRDDASQLTPVRPLAPVDAPRMGTRPGAEPRAAKATLLGGLLVLSVAIGGWRILHEAPEEERRLAALEVAPSKLLVAHEVERVPDPSPVEAPRDDRMEPPIPAPDLHRRAVEGEARVHRRRVHPAPAPAPTNGLVRDLDF